MDQPNQQEAAARCERNIEQPVQDILNIDCWEKVFDYLSFKEINNMSQTCKRLKRIAGYYIQENLPEVCGRIKLKSDELVHVQYQAVNSLVEYINVLEIDYPKDVKFKFNNYLNVKSFPSVKKLQISNGPTTEHQLRFIKGILNNIETLEISSLNIQSDSFVQLLQQCPKLKSLCFEGYVESYNCSWIHVKYPTLEYFKMSWLKNLSGSMVTKFLLNNPNIKRFEINADFMWNFRQEFKEADIQLDCLIIDCTNLDWEESNDDYDDYNDNDDEEESGCFIEFLLELQRRQFYRSLHVRSFWESQEFFDRLTQLDVNTINAIDMHEECSADISKFVHLKELCYPYFTGTDTAGLEMLAKSLVNLEKIVLELAFMEDLLPFVRYSKKLSVLRVGDVSGATPRGLLDLAKLNNERQKLKEELQGRSPRVVSIYLHETNYLATQWHMKNIRLDLIKLERME